MVRLKVTLAASPVNAPLILEALRFLMIRTRLDQGCVECAVWTVDDSNVEYLEEWETEEDMHQRVRSDGFTSLMAVMEAASAPPHIQFDFITTSRGLDYIAEVRQRRVP